MQDWYDGASPKNDDATKVRSVEDISPRKTFVWQHGYSNLSHKLDKAPRLSIRRVIWILASDTVFVQLNQYSQILRRQCCLPKPHVSLLHLNSLIWGMPFSRTGYGNIKGSARFANPSSGRGELIVSFNPCNFENLFFSNLKMSIVY